MPGQLPDIPNLSEILRRLLGQVPKGAVTTYGSLANALGNRIAARWVGHFMMHHRHNARCCCHRVVRSDGSLGLYVDGDVHRKAERLAIDGVDVRDGRVELARFCFHGFRSDRPLARLKQYQEDLAGRVSMRSRRRMPKLVAGVDVSYPRPDLAVAAYALVESDGGRLVWSTTVSRPVEFPYISSYLAFRELPVLLDLVSAAKAAGRLVEPVLVDGSGILHHRRAGIASHLGVAASLSTIGLTKKLLCGQVDLEGLEPHESRPVVHGDQLIGVALRPTAGIRRPIFVSPGHRANVSFSELVVRGLLLGRRLPEPIYWADRLSRAAGRELVPTASGET